MQALWIQQPEVLVIYAIQRGIHKHKDWQWVKAYSDYDKQCLHVRRILKSAVEKAPRYKFGIEVPRSLSHALWLDKRNGNNLWKEAIEAELKQINAYQTFRLPLDGEKLHHYTKIPYHFVFDVKFDLRRKARLVAGGNHTQPPREDIFSGVIGMETIRLGFLLLAEMNGLDVCAADISNAFL